MIIKKNYFSAKWQFLVLWIFIHLCVIHNQSKAQPLKPGFDKEEYLEMLRLAVYHSDSSFANKSYPAKELKFFYRSPSMGLETRYDLWLTDDSVGAVSIRGTTRESNSWLANFYAAMVPAKGQLELSPEFRFDYNLSEHPQAAVHVGWLISTAYISRDLLPRIDTLYKRGVRAFFITGHSQGGGVAYLLTSHLRQLQKFGAIPNDIQFKTYCSAAPKPGNLYFAYTYEALTQNGWAYNVVNSADWVPEAPVSIQTLYDFNKINLFTNARQTIKKQSFVKRIALMHVYNKLRKPPLKASKKYEHYLGKIAAKAVSKQLPGFKAPKYASGNYYVRTGNYIVLTADSAYYLLFPDIQNNPFCHHLFKQYYYLTQQYKP